MKISIGGAISVALALTVFGFPEAQAQESGSMQVGGATVSVGAGTSILTLPDVEFTKSIDFVPFPFPVVQRFTDSDDFGDEIGGQINGSISVPIGAGNQVALGGFFANIDNDGVSTCTPSSTSVRCVWQPIIDRPGSTDFESVAATGATGTVISDREVNHWGASLEFRKDMTPHVMGVTRAPSQRHWALAADVRGIYQNLSLDATAGITPGSISYDEDLDTTYYGAYLAFGGTYQPFLFKGLWSRLGLQSSFQLRGGLYYADTDYDGLYVDGVGVGTAAFSQSLSLSRSDTAFIGGLVLETSKRIGRRATLSLKSEYEFYSYVPDMTYNDIDISGGTTQVAGSNSPTSIGSDNAFSAMTSLRLTIKLGPREIMDPMQ